MIRLKLKEYEENLVKIYTNNDYEIIDYYDYDEDSGYLMTESHHVELHDSEIIQIEVIDDYVPSDYVNNPIFTNIRSKQIH